MITLKEAFLELHDRLMSQLAETIWTINRVKSMTQKEVEKFQGKGVIKGKLLVDLASEKKEREGNIKVIKEIIEQNEKQN